jgi:serine protease Do
VGAALIVALSTLAVGRLVRADDAPKVTPVVLSVNENPVNRDSNGRFTTSFAPVVKRVAQSVVKVNVETKSKTIQGGQSPFGSGNEDMLRRFFGNQFNFGDGEQGRQQRTFKTPREYGLGSGVIVSKDGYILTNNHVVDGADTIRVTLNDGREFTAKVIGHDPKSDVAVVKIDAKDLPFITIADSDKIEVGDLCLAIGNPFGIGQTVTMGIVSATGRGSVGVGTEYEDFIQTDAAINPGNSGGALVDAEGRLVGINTAILSRSGGNQGIGFAVPINLARTVMESLVTNGKVVRGYAGVSIQDVTPMLADQFKLNGQHGALVGDVMPKSPAEKAGLKSGDIIVGFNNKPVVDSRHLKLQVAETAPGSTVPVKILREGREQSVNLTVKELPGTEEIAKAGDKNDSSNDALNGVTVSDLDPAAKGQLKLPQNIKGAVVTQVEQDSPAYDAGLRPGDVIEEINRKAVQTADEAVKLTENMKEKKILLKIWSGGASHYMVVDENKAG